MNKLDNTQLSDVLCDFYIEVRKKRVPDDVNSDDPEDEDKKTSDKNTTLRAMRAALTHHFIDTRNVNIIQDPMFLKANEMFLGKTKENKEKGLGKIGNKSPQ